MNDAERIALLAANGYTVAKHPIHGLLVLLNHRVWRVAGGSFQSPSLLGLPNVSPNLIAWTYPPTGVRRR